MSPREDRRDGASECDGFRKGQQRGQQRRDRRARRMRVAACRVSTDPTPAQNLSGAEERSDKKTERDELSRVHGFHEAAGA